MQGSTPDTAISIVGGGPVGATLALALAQRGVAVTLLEAREQGVSHGDQRALALSYGSRLIFERLGLWSQLEPNATAINTIHISQRGSLGRTRLRAQEHGQPALGYVLAYGELSAALDQALIQHQARLNMLYGAQATAIQPSAESATVSFIQAGLEHSLAARLAVLADGGRSLGEISGLERKTKDYGHDALVTKVACELAHGNTAYERFTPTGPLALLPNGPRDFSLVWTGETGAIQNLMELPDEAFLIRLHEYFGDRAGRFLKTGPRMRFPLRLSYLKPVIAPHLAIIGNAAQTMHPVAGQGFNVGLRDAWELADAIAAVAPAEWGSAAMLEAYQRGRSTDTRSGMLFTDFLVNIFSNDVAGLNALRGAGLGLLDAVKPIKSRLVGKMSFGARG